jgi:protease I
MLDVRKSIEMLRLMAKRVLIPLPSHDFDPSEASIPWKILSERGIEVVFSTPTGKAAVGDQRMLKGTGLGILAPLLQADARAQIAYAEMAQSKAFLQPMPWEELRCESFDGLLLPGGHAPGMKEYLESVVLQKLVAEFFRTQKIIGAICHGVVLAARSKMENGKSVLFGRKTTSLLKSQELAAWALTCLWLGSYYRTYPTPVEDEVKAALAAASDFVSGPLAVLRDNPRRLERGFCLEDGNYLSARWPGDAHQFAETFLKRL